MEQPILEFTVAGVLGVSIRQLSTGGNVTHHFKQGLRKNSLMTETFYRDRVSDVVLGFQRTHGLKPRDLADLAGCSYETMCHARDGEHSLSGRTLLNLLTISETCLEGFLHYFDRRSVPMTAKCDTDVLVTATAAVHKLAVAASHSIPISDQECLDLESALDAAIDGLCGLKSRCLNIRKGANA